MNTPARYNVEDQVFFMRKEVPTSAKIKSITRFERGKVTASIDGKLVEHPINEVQVQVFYHFSTGSGVIEEEVYPSRKSLFEAMSKNDNLNKR
jgi:hypothetical protein